MLIYPKGLLLEWTCCSVGGGVPAVSHVVCVHVVNLRKPQIEKKTFQKSFKKIKKIKPGCCGYDSPSESRLIPQIENKLKMK